MAIDKKGFETVVKNNRTASNFRNTSVDLNKNLNKTHIGAFFDKRNVDKFEQRMNSLNLSDGFKKIFPFNPKDKKMVIPIAGYAGHRRGDRS